MGPQGVITTVDWWFAAAYAWQPSAVYAESGEAEVRGNVSAGLNIVRTVTLGDCGHRAAGAAGAAACRRRALTGEKLRGLAVARRLLERA